MMPENTSSVVVVDRNWKYRIRKMMNSASGSTMLSRLLARTWFSNEPAKL